MTKTVKIGLVLLFLGIMAIVFQSPYSITAGIILILTSVYCLFFIGQRKIKYLKENGLKIQAKIQYILATVSKAGRDSTYTFKIVCKGKNTTDGILDQYTSDGMLIQPDINIDDRSLIDVYVNPKNTKDYWVDISKIPIKQNIHYRSMFPGFNPLSFNYFKSYDGVNFEKSDNPN